MKRTILLLAISLMPAIGFAQSYSVNWHKISGGGGTSTNGQFAITGTIGQPDAGSTMSGGNFSVTGGFWSLISLVQTAGAPPLILAHSGNNITISWPSSSGGFVLQQTSDLSAGSWTPAGFSISNDGTNKSITITSPTGNLFFRLQHP